jgi:anaerobic selenocysteine-containing dehydrogenase
MPSARWADLLLPAASCWEREGLQAGFFVDEAAEAHVQLRPAVVQPRGVARSDTANVFDFARVLGLSDAFFQGDVEAGLPHILAPSGLDVGALRAKRRVLAEASRSREGSCI